MRDGIQPEELGFRPRVVGVIEIRRDFGLGDGALSSPGAVGL